MINALAAFGLGYLFFKFVQESNGAEGLDDSPQEEAQEESTPPTPYDTGKEECVLTSVYESGGFVLYKLEILQGQAYELNGEITDETYYQTVGYVVGDVGQSSFTTQNDSAGAYTFTKNGITHENVRIFTQEGGTSYIDEKVSPPDDPDAPQKPEEPEEPPALPPMNQPGLPSFGYDLPFNGGF